LESIQVCYCQLIDIESVASRSLKAVGCIEPGSFHSHSFAYTSIHQHSERIVSVAHLGIRNQNFYPPSFRHRPTGSCLVGH